MAIETLGPLTITVADTQTEKSQEIKRNGRLRTAIFETPALSGVTATLDILDSNDNIIYQEAGVAGSTKKGEDAVDLQRELYGTITLKVTMTGTQTGDKEFKVKLIYEKVAG